MTIDPKRLPYLSPLLSDAMKFLNENSTQVALQRNIAAQSMQLAMDFVDTTSAAQLYKHLMPSLDMPAKTLIEMARAAEMKRIAPWLNVADMPAASLVEHYKNKDWLSTLRLSSILEKTWADTNRQVAYGLAEYAERARAQMITANTEIAALFSNESVKALWEKYADTSAFATRTSTEDDTDEVGPDAAEEVASLVEAETLRFAIQSLSDTAHSLHALATTPDSKGQAERANIIAARGVVIAYIALFVAILTMIMTPFWDAYVKECLLKGDLKCKTLFEGAGSEKQTAKDDAAFDLYRSARRITARNLTLRLNAKGLSPAVANIGTGALVIVLREGDDWTLIEADVSGSKRAGWVYTRYLIKI